MSRRAAEIKLSQVKLSQEETDELNRWVKSGKTERRKVHRAVPVLLRRLTVLSRVADQPAVPFHLHVLVIVTLSDS
ncbi:MAG TPA: hypothetical protein VE860_22950 [Chthoniobacterales bacterium]|nr:hypothetical protein [Chthoniobacterales bacterium]